MSNIDKQAVHAVADLKAGYTLGHADVEIIQQMALDAVTLMGELEAKDSRIGELEVIATDYGMKFQRAQDALKHQSLLHKTQMEAAEKRIAELEARDAKPVAWRLINSHESSLSVTDNKHIADVWKRNGRDVQALFPASAVGLVPVGTALSDGRQMSAHNKSMVVDVMVESGKLTPGDKVYIAAAAVKGE